MVCNKKIGIEETQNILTKFEAKFSSYKLERQEISAYIKLTNENIDEMVKRIIEFLNHEIGN